MKKIPFLILAVLVILLLPAAAFAAPPEETKIILERCALSPDPVPAGEEAVLTLTLRNTHPKKDAWNMTVTVVPGDDALTTQGTQTLYVDKLAAGASADVSFDLRALPDAASGVHSVTVTLGYEDSRGFPLTVTQTVTLEIAQPLRLAVDAAQTASVNPGEPVVVRISIHNLGKDPIRNLTADAAGDHLDAVSPVYAGNLDSGQTAALEVTLRMDDDALKLIKDSDAWTGVAPGDPDPVMEFSGSVTLTCEDARGQSYDREVSFTAPVLIPKPDEPDYSVSSGQTASGTRLDLTGWVVAGVMVVIAAAVTAVAVWNVRKRSGRS